MLVEIELDVLLPQVMDKRLYWINLRFELLLDLGFSPLLLLASFDTIRDVLAQLLELDLHLHIQHHEQHLRASSFLLYPDSREKTSGQLLNLYARSNK